MFESMNKTWYEDEEQYKVLKRSGLRPPLLSSGSPDQLRHIESRRRAKQTSQQSSNDTLGTSPTQSFKRSQYVHGRVRNG